jgi:tripartite ATP-independent transporter DctM subunit
MGFIIFMVLGMILLGLATPSEAASSGVVATILVTIVYRRFNWKMFRTSIKGTLEISVMIFMIIAASKTFSSILAYTGATQGLLSLVEGTDLHPLIILISMQALVFIMGTFMETISIMMICLPIFMPIIKVLGFDPVWFGIIVTINVEMGMITPPVGLNLFILKGSVPGITMKDIVGGSLPFLILLMLGLILIMIFPSLATWLPGRMGF